MRKIKPKCDAYHNELPRGSLFSLIAIRHLELVGCTSLCLDRKREVQWREQYKCDKLSGVQWREQYKCDRLSEVRRREQYKCDRLSEVSGSQARVGIVVSCREYLLGRGQLLLQGGAVTNESTVVLDQLHCYTLAVVHMIAKANNSSPCHHWLSPSTTNSTVRPMGVTYLLQASLVVTLESGGVLARPFQKLHLDWSAAPDPHPFPPIDAYTYRLAALRAT